MTYLIIGLILTFSIFFFEKKKNTGFFYWTLCIILILLAGLRNYVGGDTIGYMNMWDSLPTFNQKFEFLSLTNLYQPFWYVINAIAKYIYDDFVTIQIILAIIVNFSIFTLFDKYSNYRFTCVLIYYLMTYPYFNFEILRESLSISILIISMPFLIKKKWIKYFLLSIIAFLFHSSAIILFFLPFSINLFNKKVNLKSMTYIIILTFLLGNSYTINFIIDNLFPFLAPLAEIYSEWEWSAIGYFIASLKCLFVFLLIVLRQKHNISQVMIDVPLKIYMFFTILSLTMPIAQRFQNYFILFFIIGLVDLLWRFKGKELVIKNTILLFFTSITIHYYLQDTSGLTGEKSRFGQRFYPYYSVFDEVKEKDIYIRKSIYYNISKYDY